MTGLWLPLVEVAALLLGAGGVGHALASPLVAPAAGRAERIAWGFAAGLALLAVSAPLGFLTGISPRWIAVLLAVLSVAFSLSRRERAGVTGAPGPSNPKSEIRRSRSVLLLALVVLGVCLYLLRSLTEPMWSNDFLAIWGFKGKTLFAAGGIPRRLFTDSSLAYSHPEYPLGLPFLYAAIAFVLGRWDDHAMALLFPALQIATLFALYGWLRRRGGSHLLALAAAALLAQLEPL